MRNISASGIYAAGTLLLTGGAVRGVEPSDYLLFSTGSYSLRPQLNISEVFNDNIFFRNDRKQSDFITTISPGLVLQLGTEEANFISLSYYFDRLQYLDETSLNANQHRIALGSHVQFNRLTIEGQDRIEFLSSALGGGISLSGVKVDRTTYYDQYRLTYDFSERTGVYLEGSHSTTDYQEGIRLFDVNSLIGTLGFHYRAFSRSFLFGEVYYGQTAADPNFDGPKPPHATFIGGYVGARGYFTEKLTGSVKAGVESREFSDGTPVGEIPVVEAELTEMFSEKTVLTASYSRRQHVSVQYSRAGYTLDLVSLYLRQEIGNDGRFHAVARGSYGMAEYEPNPSFQDRSDRLIAAGLELTYDFKIWLRGRFGYDYEHLDSDLPAIVEYDVNRVTLGLSIGY